MKKKRTYYGFTTVQQRQLLFETWQETGSVTKACQVAHVSRGTFYRWQTRFADSGVGGLTAQASREPHHQPKRKSEAIEKKVIEAHQGHPEWGKARIAQELAKANNWEPVVSLNTVRKILERHGLWPARGVKKKTDEPAVRHAEQAGEAVNIDVCFVPTEHLGQKHLPAVSGSSGRLVLCHREARKADASWPGQVFGQPELTYAESMLAYIAATRDRLELTRSTPGTRKTKEPSAWRKEHQRQEIWYPIRQRRQQEDAAWRVAKATYRQALHRHRSLSREARQLNRAEWNSQQTTWQQLRQQHKHGLAERKIKTAAWHERNRQSHAVDLTGAALPWIAILVVTDNCSRQCLGLPLFQSGAHLTSQELSHAMEQCLPPHLAFLISDQDFRFRSHTFAQLAQARGFVHVPVYRHRPQSNGIAEHFVWTLKDWLYHASWDSSQQLAPLLTIFCDEYNDRPHQGLPLPGLSPNEFARRIWLL